MLKLLNPSGGGYFDLHMKFDDELYWKHDHQNGGKPLMSCFRKSLPPPSNDDASAVDAQVVNETVEEVKGG